MAINQGDWVHYRGSIEIARRGLWEVAEIVATERGERLRLRAPVGGTLRNVRPGSVRPCDGTCGCGR